MAISICKRRVQTKDSPCTMYIKGGMCKRLDEFRCLDFLAQREPVLSHSSLNNLMRCPAMFYYANIKGRQSRKKSIPLIMGIVGERLIAGHDMDDILRDEQVSIEQAKQELWYYKVRAIKRAFDELVEFDQSEYDYQKKFIVDDDNLPKIKGITDWSSKPGDPESHFIDLKISSRPDNYTQPTYIKQQFATYFLSNSNYQAGIVWVIRVPELKQTGQFKDELFEDYEDRCFRDMCNRPKFYFSGYNPKTKMFGVKYYRSESWIFDLEKVKKRYQWYVKEAFRMAKENYWPERTSSCYSPFTCEFVGIQEGKCGIDSDIFIIRKKEV